MCVCVCVCVYVYVCVCVCVCVCVGVGVGGWVGGLQLLYNYYMHNGNGHKSSKPTPALVPPLSYHINNCAAANLSTKRAVMVFQESHISALSSPVPTPVPTPVTCNSEDMKDNQANMEDVITGL